MEHSRLIAYDEPTDLEVWCHFQGKFAHFSHMADPIFTLLFWQPDRYLSYFKLKWNSFFFIPFSISIIAR